MWKVMVADDEMYMLEALEKLINWKGLDCKLVYKAKNGEELLAQIKKEVPDIVITDIKMPLVTGLEVAKYVYEKMLPTKIIILSAYADFDYAQEAIQYDVCGYIVKTSAIEKRAFAEGNVIIQSVNDMLGFYFLENNRWYN